MVRIISFFLSVVFSIDMFFVGLSPEKQLIITQTARKRKSPLLMAIIPPMICLATKLKSAES